MFDAGVMPAAEGSSFILDGLSTEEIIEDAVKLYETPEEVIAPSFERFIESLLRSGYLEKSEL